MLKSKSPQQSFYGSYFVILALGFPLSPILRPESHLYNLEKR